MTNLASTLQAFFTTRLTSQYGVSSHTVVAYRDTWRLSLGYAAQSTGTAPAQLDLSQLDANLINGFLTDLETRRDNSISTRNARLAAVHSFLTYASRYHPEQLAIIGRVLAIPPKRRPRNEICYLTDTEVTALLAAPDPTTRAGRRDHSMFQLAVTAGLRVSELTGLRVGDIHLGTGADVLCHGKGRKNRATPMDRQTVQILKTFIPTRTGTEMSRDAVAAPPNSPATRKDSCSRLAYRNRREILPEPDIQDSGSARTQAHCGDATVDRGNRYQHTRALARPRKHRNHAGLPPHRHDHEGERPESNHANRNPTRTIQTARRRPHSLPAQSLIMPISPASVPP